MSILQTDSLTKSYGKARGVIELNLSVDEGEFFGFIGPNGAGKSTTIRTLLGLIRPTSGRALLFGKDISAHRERLLADVGYLPSESFFYNGMKVGEVLQLSARLRGKDCSDEARKLCRRLDLDVSRRVETLSLGNRKKVGIVCALQHRPRLLILDEPTSGLDPLIQRALFEVLEERHRDGATIFLSSHVLSEVQRHCARAGIIREGRLIACGPIDELSRDSARRVVLHGVSDFPALPGVRSLEKEANSVSFLYQGPIPALIDRLQGLPLTDVHISEPSLEEIFMHYYEKEGSAQ